MSEGKSANVLLSLVCGALAGGVIGFVASPSVSDVTTASTGEREVLERLDEIATTLKAIRADANASPRSSESAAGDQPSRAIPDPNVTEALIAIREELKHNAAKTDALLQREPDLGAPARAEPDVAFIKAQYDELLTNHAGVRTRHIMKSVRDVLREFGKPTEISTNGDGSQSWYYAFNGADGPTFWVQFHSGYVIRVGH